jgi:hypothetical protein
MELQRVKPEPSEHRMACLQSAQKGRGTTTPQRSSHPTSVAVSPKQPESNTNDASDPQKDQGTGPSLLLLSAPVSFPSCSFLFNAYNFYLYKSYTFVNQQSSKKWLGGSRISACWWMSVSGLVQSSHFVLLKMADRRVTFQKAEVALAGPPCQ